MNLRRALPLVGLIGAATALQGCIAVAAPIVAGAALATRVGKDRGTPKVVVPPPVQTATGAAPTQTAPLTDPSEEFPTVFAAFSGGELPPAGTSAAAPPPIGLAVPAALPEAAPGAARVTFFSNAEAPPPGGALTAPTDLPVYAAFRTYSLNLSQANRTLGGMPSALLTTPGSLSPERASCAKEAPAVLIDLDPGRGTFDPSQSAGKASGLADPALAPTLAELRAANVGVIWMTRLGENFAELVRGSLRESGLDPEGEDRLVMMRTIAERKQTRRDALGEQNCIVAILGDERADFDELYLYLKDADAALALERIVGSGWFLTGGTP